MASYSQLASLTEKNNSILGEQLCEISRKINHPDNQKPAKGKKVKETKLGV